MGTFNRRLVFLGLTIILTLALIACGEEATPTAPASTAAPTPATAAPAPTATAASATASPTTTAAPATMAPAMATPTAASTPAPAGAQLAKVRDTVYTQGDLAKRLRLRHATTGSVDLSPAPWEALFGMVEAELIRQGADFEGVVVTDEDVEAALRLRFYPQAPEGQEGQEVEQGQLEAEYQEAYQSFLNFVQISDDEYRMLVSDEVYRIALRERLGERIPERLDHAEVSWVQLPRTSPDLENPPPAYQDILERLSIEEFADVAAEVGGGSGYQGWVPRGAYPFLDDTLFGTEDEEPLAAGEFSEPIISEDATYIVKSLTDIEARRVEDKWLNGLKQQALQTWINEQWALGRQEGWLEVYTNSGQYGWVVDQYNKSVYEERNQSEDIKDTLNKQD